MIEFVSLIASLGATFLCGVQVGKGWRRPPDRDPEFDRWRAALKAEIMGDLAPAALREVANDRRRAA